MFKKLFGFSVIFPKTDNSIRLKYCFRRYYCNSDDALEIFDHFGIFGFCCSMKKTPNSLHSGVNHAEGRLAYQP